MTLTSGLPEFSVGAVQQDGHVVVTVRGELDLATAPEFGRAIATEIHDHPGPLIVDLSRVSFMDSSGVDVLVRASRLAERAAGGLTIRASAPCRRIIELTGLDAVLEVTDETT